MTRIEKLLRALQASQVMPDAGNAKPAPVVDVAAAGVIIVKLSGGSLDGKHDTLEGALSQSLSKARALAASRLSHALAAADEARGALAAIDAAMASRDD